MSNIVSFYDIGVLFGTLIGCFFGRNRKNKPKDREQILMSEQVLIDLCVIVDAVTHRTVLETRNICFGDISQEIEVAIRKPFPPGQDEHFKKEQIPYIASLPKLVKDRKIELCHSIEIIMESIHGSRDRGYLGLDLLEEVPFKSINPPLNRTIIFDGLGNNIGTTKKEQIRFFKSIHHPRFMEIRKYIGDAHIIDAYHFWTAENANLNFFLTTDQKLIRVYKNSTHLRRTSNVKVVSPKNLCLEFGFGPTDIEETANNNPPFA